MTEPADLRIDRERLFESIRALAAIGAYREEASGLVGVSRLALGDADAEARRLVRSWFERAGLEVRVDRIGNTYGARCGYARTEPCVLVGSHIDTVPTGGAFDGALGVLAALEIVRTLDEHSVGTRRTIEIAFFTDEEGARFGTDMLGSATACGRIALLDAYACRDERGVSVKDELTRIGWCGDVDPCRDPPHVYLELHIEQGPILASKGVEVGIVRGVQGISWHELTIIGKAAHAGATPMEMRHDAGLAASMLNVFLHERTRAGDFGDGMRVTMGRIDPHPNRVNIVPARVIATVDLRNPIDRELERAEMALTTEMERVSRALGVEIRARRTARTPAVPFSSAVQSRIRANATSMHLSHEDILSGAGHDAQEFAAICPSGMIFVPGEYDGISHNPREFSTKDACGNGADLLLRTVLDFAMT